MALVCGHPERLIITTRLPLSLFPLFFKVFVVLTSSLVTSENSQFHRRWVACGESRDLLSALAVLTNKQSQSLNLFFTSLPSSVTKRSVQRRVLLNIQGPLLNCSRYLKPGIWDFLSGRDFSSFDWAGARCVVSTLIQELFY